MKISESELIDAMDIAIVEGAMPTDEQLKKVSEAWKAALDSPYRMYADKDFLAGAIWGIQIVTGKFKQLNKLP